MEPQRSPAVGHAMQPPQSRWRIVKEEAETDQPPRFAVVRDDRRVAWGLRDRAAAVRWLKRLSAPQQPALTLSA